MLTNSLIWTLAASISLAIAAEGDRREARLWRVTAYCPCKACCGPNASGVTANGRPAKGKIVAVDPKIIPLGSRVHVPGYGWAVAADTGGAIKGKRIDVLLPTHAAARRFGVKWLAVKVDGGEATK